MQWTVRLETTTSAGEVKTTELVTFSRPAMVSTLAEIGLVLDETKTLLAKLQASVLSGQVAAYAAHHRVCAACGMLQPLKDRRTRRLQTLFGTVEVEAPRLKGSLNRLVGFQSWMAEQGYVVEVTKPLHDRSRYFLGCEEPDQLASIPFTLQSEWRR